MKIQKIQIQDYAISLTHGFIRSGLMIQFTDAEGNTGTGEIAPLPNWSKESLSDAIRQLEKIRSTLLETEWSVETCFDELAKLSLLPSVSFGIESALLSILSPLPEFSIEVSALFMGSCDEILAQASLRAQEGYRSAKLKVSNHNFKDAARLIEALKDQFHLRIDVNRAWSTSEALRFFSHYPQNAFDYVEEPFQNPQDLHLFTHPLAVDESFPCDLSLKSLEQIPSLKALIYKPTMQGGMSHCLPLMDWTAQRGKSLILSASFETEIGLSQIVSMAQRLALTVPVGLGTYHYLMDNHRR